MDHSQVEKLKDSGSSFIVCRITGSGHWKGGRRFVVVIGVMAASAGDRRKTIVRGSEGQASDEAPNLSQEKYLIHPSF